MSGSMRIDGFRARVSNDGVLRERPIRFSRSFGTVTTKEEDTDGAAERLATRARIANAVAVQSATRVSEAIAARPGCLCQVAKRYRIDARHRRGRSVGRPCSGCRCICTNTGHLNLGSSLFLFRGPESSLILAVPKIRSFGTEISVGVIHGPSATEHVSDIPMRG